MDLSYSIISQYRWCPRQYEFGYVMQIPAPMPWALYWGRCFHEGLESAFRAKMEGGSSSIDAIAEGVSVFEEAIARGVTDDFFRNVVNFTEKIDWGDISESEAMVIGKNMIQVYLEEYIDILKPIGIEQVTKREIEIDGVIYPFTSHLDLVTEEMIIDHKTSNKPWYQSRADKELQATCYLWNKPGNQEAFVYHVILRQYNSRIYSLLTRRTQKQIDDLEQNIIPNVVRKILKGDFPETLDNWKCGFCGYRPLCKGA